MGPTLVAVGNDADISSFVDPMMFYNTILIQRAKSL